MVTPIYIFIIALGIAFLLPLLERAKKGAAETVFLAALSGIALISWHWLFSLLTGRCEIGEIFTAGFRPPFSINLRVGMEEAVFTSAINLATLAGAVYLIRELSGRGTKSMMLYLLFVMGMNGMVLTRDIFNLFVFMEITGIASYALVALRLDTKGLTAGFKYAIAGSLASIFMLLGIIVIYMITGTLNIDSIASRMVSFSGTAAAGFVAPAVFMLVFAFMIEMKQFPANGWALDVYDSAAPGISAMISAGSAGAALFAIYKILPIAGEGWYMAAAITGSVTFVAANLIGLKQERAGRLLGYSSIGQMGLLLTVVSLGLKGSLPSWQLIAVGLFINHLLAKAGLFWLTGITGEDRIRNWGVIARRPFLLMMMGLFMAALSGFPPFPAFWSKWTLVMSMFSGGMKVWVVFILLGSLFEVAYLFRWFGYAVRGGVEDGESGDIVKGTPEKTAVIFFGAALLTAVAYYMMGKMIDNSTLMLMPLVGAAGLLLFERFDPRVRGIVSLAAVLYYGYMIIPGLSGMPLFFNSFFLGGGAIMLLATLHRRTASRGFYPMLLLMIGSLSALALSSTSLQFFYAWELMTFSSYILVLRGKKAMKPALLYMVFSAAGAYLVMAGFASAGGTVFGGAGDGIAGMSGSLQMFPFILLAAGFLVKVAGMGLHVWAPGAYAEAEDDSSAIISSILSKAGVLGFVFLFIKAGTAFTGSTYLYSTIGWIGAITAFFGALYAAMQEDAKKLLAWSSIGQVGYMILGLAAMNQIGWVAALYHSVSHFMFKGLLFLAVAGVVYRTGTRNMYEMGGLIKRMPMSFISVMIGIIALSGVPPLTGFGGKWLLYNALIERGWYLQAALAFFSSTVAFLYCFRLVHAIFLGQAKPAFRKIKEAPRSLIAAQYILIMAIMMFSMKPSILIKPIMGIVGERFDTLLTWQANTLYSPFGYWNGFAVMMVVCALFAILLVILLLISPKPQKVKQFNIVFAAERPETPETTHYAWKFFTPYERAFSGILKPAATRFWNAVGEWAEAVAAMSRHIYSGNTGAYVVQIFIFGILLFILSRGGLS